MASSIGWMLFSPAVVNTAIIKWFVVRRGFALAIGSIGVPLSAIISPIVITPIVDTYGFRTGYTVLSIAVLIIITPIALMMIRQPEDIGLLPDGISSEKQTNKDLSAIQEDDLQTYTRSQAIKTWSFWLLTVGYGLNAAALSTIALYAIPFTTNIGYTRSLGAIALSISGIGNLSSKILWGWGLQKFDARRLAGLALSTSATGVLFMILTSYTEQPIFLIIGFFLYGFGFGSTIPVSEFLWSRYFGRRYIASIQSVGRPVTAILAITGPVGAGVLYDISSSYIVAFFLVACVYLIGALSINISNNPPKLHNNA
jgi:MFS family permease